MDSPHCKKTYAICLMGPTACGKTDLALTISQQYKVEIINVDSAQIYQGMDIGSGKPPVHIREKIKHHLMDFLDPSTPYSAAQFRHDALTLMEEITRRGRTPLLVGGTMLYYKILQEGMATLPDASMSVRKQLDALAAEKGWQFLYEMLVQNDPISAMRIKPSDTQRIQRALEIHQLTGHPMSYWLAQPKQEMGAPYQFINLALVPIQTSRSVLHERIQIRFDAMLAQGLIEEVKNLIERNDLHDSLPSIRAVGYRQVWKYLKQEMSYEEMREKAIAATRQLAKRQLTWLRGWPALQQFDFLCPDLPNTVSGFLHHQGIESK
ncbi:MAG: tRNA (adenosine(37)-N6)-dimethylallyltransferase MiaA [Gammaproteobacteria bacterium]|jgi:tRNA dimethylallyltransferase|nr:tRNA (adenosine(37)-N6)-dimethylallyltransferase MiaA [Gammaproteobacteria bacterium]